MPVRPCGNDSEEEPDLGWWSESKDLDPKEKGTDPEQEDRQPCGLQGSVASRSDRYMLRENPPPNSQLKDFVWAKSGHRE